MWQASDKHRGEWPARVRVRAVLGLAPVKFDDPEGDHSDTLITTLPFTVMTGTCDGAVGEAGQQYLDDVAGLNTVTELLGVATGGEPQLLQHGLDAAVPAR